MNKPSNTEYVKEYFMQPGCFNANIVGLAALFFSFIFGGFSAMLACSVIVGAANAVAALFFFESFKKKYDLHVNALNQEESFEYACHRFHAFQGRAHYTQQASGWQQLQELTRSIENLASTKNLLFIDSAAMMNFKIQYLYNCNAFHFASERLDDLNSKIKALKTENTLSPTEALKLEIQKSTAKALKLQQKINKMQDQALAILEAVEDLHTNLITNSGFSLSQFEESIQTLKIENEIEQELMIVKK